MCVIVHIKSAWISLEVLIEENGRTPRGGNSQLEVVSGSCAQGSQYSISFNTARAGVKGSNYINNVFRRFAFSRLFRLFRQPTVCILVSRYDTYGYCKGPPGYIGSRNRLFGIDSWAPTEFVF